MTVEEIKAKHQPRQLENQVEFDAIMSDINQQQGELNRPLIDRKMEIVEAARTAQHSEAGHQSAVVGIVGRVSGHRGKGKGYQSPVARPQTRMDYAQSP